MIRVLITGAAGQIGYSLIPLIAKGTMFGENVKVVLHLLDVEMAMKALMGVVMEIEDGAYPLVAGVVATSDIKTAFSDIDVAILVGAMPRKPGMERADLLKINCGIFKTQGEALNNYANPNVKVLVVGNPANTNCAIAQTCAPKIPAKNFTCLTRLDHNRAVSLLARVAKRSISEVKNVVIWGNHSSTQFPDASHATIGGVAASEVLKNTPGVAESFLRDEFVKTVQKRGAAVIEARGLSSAMSAANAICDHMRDWFLGSSHVTSMGVYSDGVNTGVKYDHLSGVNSATNAHLDYPEITQGVIYSFPVVCKGNWEWEIVGGWGGSKGGWEEEMREATKKELVEERETAHSFLG